MRLGIVVGTALFSTPAHAYLDPGTGSIILQGVLASIAVAIGVIRAYWFRLKSFFSRTPAQSSTPKDPEQPTETEAGGSA